MEMSEFGKKNIRQRFPVDRLKLEKKVKTFFFSLCVEHAWARHGRQKQEKKITYTFDTVCLTVFGSDECVRMGLSGECAQQ